MEGLFKKQKLVLSQGDPQVTQKSQVFENMVFKCISIFQKLELDCKDKIGWSCLIYHPVYYVYIT